MPNTSGAVPREGNRGTTHLHVGQWKPVANKNGPSGSRVFMGIAYNAAIDGERSRTTCPDDVWFNDDEDVFYEDESIAWERRELEAQNLQHKPIRLMHKDAKDYPAVGTIHSNFVDSDGNLVILAEIPCNSPAQERLIKWFDEGKCDELSIGYELLRDPRTHEVYHGDIDEVSLVTEAHFRGCRALVKAGRKSEAGGRDKRFTTEYRRGVRAGRAQPNDDDAKVKKKFASGFLEFVKNGK